MKKSLKCFFYFAACFLMLFLMIPQKVLAIEPEPTQVDEIKFKVDIPIVGQEAGKPGYAIKEETEGIFCTDGLTGINDTSTAWFVKNGSEWVYFPEGSTFENGKEYGIRFALGYDQFDYKITDTAKAYVNGKSAELTYHTSTYSGNGYVVFYSFGVLDKDKVYKITVDGGYAKNYSTGINVTEAKAGQRIELVAEAPDKDHGIWYWDGDGVPSSAAAEAVTNHFTFIMPAHDVDVKAVWGKLIKNAGCTITNPVAGKEVDKAPVSWEPDKYSVSYSKLIGTSDSGKLIAGNHYEYVVEFIPEPGYVLDMLCDYSVNDSSAFCGGVGIFADGTRRFSVYEKYEFYAHDDSATEINKIVINGITPPAVGEPITIPSLTPGTEGYEIVDAEWHGYAITGNYTGYSSGAWLGEKFNDKTVYVLWVAVQPKEGYYFNRFITNISADQPCEFDQITYYSTYNQYGIQFRFNDLGTNYTIESGDGSTWEMGSSEGITFVVNGKYEDFLVARIDNSGSELTNFYKKAASGDTNTTLTIGNDTNMMPESLGIGKHTITFIFKDGSVTGNFRIVPKDHTHKENLTKVDSKEATCTVDGNEEYYVCSCGAWFEDSEATKEIANHDAVVIKASHRDNDNDGTCDVCGYNLLGGTGGDPDPGPGGDPDPDGDPNPDGNPGGDPNPDGNPDGDPVPPPVVTDYLDALYNMLLTVEPGSVVEWNVGTALPYDVMKLVKEKDITLIFSYTYENNDYVVKITKDNVPKQVVPWYGPKFLAGLSGRTVTLSGNVYTVVAGDTLSMIAARFNTTVDEILKKNPQIDNPDYIYVGQQISL